MSIAITHQAAQSRFVHEQDGHTGALDYRQHDGVMTITHTGVPDALGGRGIAGELVHAALRTARESGWRVRSTCWYATRYIERHPEWADLLAARTE